MKENLMKEIFSDMAFVKSLLELETAEAMQAELKKKGIDVSESRMAEFKDELTKIVEKIGENDQLSADQLDDVVGGLFYDNDFMPPFGELKKKSPDKSIF